MQRKYFIVLAVVLVAVAGYVGYRVLTGRAVSPLETTSYSYNGLDIQISYSRPYKKGRVIFGSKEEKALLPFGKYWRLGANEATEISFSKDITFAGQPIKAGRYRMYAVPNKDSWQVSLNSELGKFGYFEPNYSMDIAKVDVPVQPAPSEAEQLTIAFSDDANGVNMDLVWDTTMVRVPITIQ